MRNSFHEHSIVMNLLCGSLFPFCFFFFFIWFVVKCTDVAYFTYRNYIDKPVTVNKMVCLLYSLFRKFYLRHSINFDTSNQKSVWYSANMNYEFHSAPSTACIFVRPLINIYHYFDWKWWAGKCIYSKVDKNHQFDSLSAIWMKWNRIKVASALQIIF